MLAVFDKIEASKKEIVNGYMIAPEAAGYDVLLSVSSIEKVGLDKVWDMLMGFEQTVKNQIIGIFASRANA